MRVTSATSVAISFLLLFTELTRPTGTPVQVSDLEVFASHTSDPGPTRNDLYSAARAGGEYLIRVQRADGSFRYDYNAASNRFESHTYNILRHAGTAFSLLELYSATRDTRYLIAARRAVKFLKTRFKRVPASTAVFVLDYDGKAKLGANGLSLVALTKLMEVDPASSNTTSSERLAELILKLQRKDGSFNTRYRLRVNEPPAPPSLYYPGEAIVGLVRLFKLNGSKRLLDAARRGADYLVASQRAMQPLPPDAWLMQALESLHAVGKESRYAEHALALADAMIADQYSEGDPQGYDGGFGPGSPRVTPAASRAEGLVAAYRIARAIRDQRAQKIASALKASARFQLTRQASLKTPGLANPSRAAGGFYEFPNEPRIRIDFVQHNISALLGIANALYQ